MPVKEKGSPSPKKTNRKTSPKTPKPVEEIKENGESDFGILTKEGLKGVIGYLMTLGEVIAPTHQGENRLFSPISSVEEADLGYTNTKLSAKGSLFPQTEVLFYYDRVSQEVTPPRSELKKRFLVGIRPCDARALAWLDLVFDDPQYQDIPYLQRRQNTLVIGLACTQPQDTCFCTSTGGGPSDTTGLDILLEEIKEGYLVTPVTEKGKAALKGWPGLQPAGEEEIQEAKGKSHKITQGMRPLFDLEEVYKKISSSFNTSFWDTVYEKCLGCATCSFVCPTCHCFDIQDENRKARGRRVRFWDSCQFPLFTLHTSGHNPRTSGKERLRQRMMHKFSYFKENFGHIACVGCGRCIRECPVSMDLREILAGCMRSG